MAERSGRDEFPAQALEPVAAEMFANGFDAKLCVLTSIAVSQRRLAKEVDALGWLPVVAIFCLAALVLEFGQ